MNSILRFAGAALLSGALIVTTQIEPNNVTKEKLAYVQTQAVQALAAEETPEKPWHIVEDVRVYHYCACEKCCGKSENDPAYQVTKSGTTVEEGRTIAVDPDIIPLGSDVVIGGHTYIAEDTGGAIKGYKVDIYVEDHQAALEAGTYVTDLKWR